MATTPNLLLTLPLANDLNWGTTLNTNMSLIDTAVTTANTNITTANTNIAARALLAGNPAQVFSVAPATLAAHAVRFDQSFGVGQTWANMTASRVLGTTYTNTTTKLKKVMVSGQGTVANASNTLIPTVSGVGLPYQSGYAQAANTGWMTIAAFEVPAGATYSVAGTNSTLSQWFEF